MEFGEKLKQAREEKGITQQTLANQLYVTRQAVSRWECGARFPDLLTAKKISEYLEVSLDELLSPDETTKCIEESPIIESPVILQIQTALYGFHGMAYLLLILCSLYLWGYSIEDVRQYPSVLLSVLPTLLTRMILMFLTFWGLYFSVKGKLSPKKTAMLPIFFCGTHILLSLTSFLYHCFGTNTYSFQALLRLLLLYVFLSTFCIISVYRFFFLQKSKWRFGIYAYFAYYTLTEEIITFVQARRSSIDTEMAGMFGILRLLADISFVVLILYQTYALHKKRQTNFSEKMY